MGDALSLPSLCAVPTCDTHGSVSTVVAKNLWTLLASCLGSECSLPFTGRHPDSSSRHGSFKEHQSPRPSSSPVGCCPCSGVLKEKTIGPHVLRKPCRKPSFGLWRGLRHPTLPRHTFIRGLPLCQRRSSTWRSRVTCNVGSCTIASRGTGFESPFLPPTTVTERCPAPRLMAVAGHSRGHSVPAQAKLIDPVELHTKYVRVGATLHRGGRGGAPPLCCRATMRIKPGFVAVCPP